MYLTQFINGSDFVNYTLRVATGQCSVGEILCLI